MQAELKIPSRVVVDRWGQIFIADRGNSVIRRIDRKGFIATVLGVGDIQRSDGAGRCRGRFACCGSYFYRASYKARVVLGALTEVRGAPGIRALVSFDPQALRFNHYLELASTRALQPLANTVGFRTCWPFAKPSVKTEEAPISILFGIWMRTALSGLRISFCGLKRSRIRTAFSGCVLGL